MDTVLDQSRRLVLLYLNWWRLVQVKIFEIIILYRVDSSHVDNFHLFWFAYWEIIDRIAKGRLGSLGRGLKTILFFLISRIHKSKISSFERSFFSFLPSFFDLFFIILLIFVTNLFLLLSFFAIRGIKLVFKDMFNRFIYPVFIFS